jgi:Uma2 family endonuclease
VDEERLMTERTKITVQEYETFLALPENADRRFELVNGEIVEHMPTILHGIIISLINFFIVQYLRQHLIGFCTVEARYRLPNDKENDLIPNLSFVANERGEITRSGPAPYMPDLAVEVQSEGQSKRFMLDKAILYLANGTRMVWIVYPESKILEVLTNDARDLLTINDTLTGRDVLPGFSVPVRELFPPDDQLNK